MVSLLKMKGFGILSIIVLSVSLSLYGCGGGGDGGGGDTGGSMAYSGNTSQVTINQTNAVAIVKGAFTGGQVSSSFGAIGAVQEVEIERPTYLQLTQSIEEAIRQIDVHASPGATVAGAVHTESGSIPGPCGGNAGYSIQLNDTTGQFSGNIAFTGFCSGGTIMNGSVAFSGTINMSSGIISGFTVTISSITGSAGSVAFTATGSISYTFSSSGFTATTDLRMRYDTTGKVYWVNNYTISATVSPSYVQVGVSGKFYDPDYGYVDISTPTPFRITTGQNWPSQGVMIASGKNGTKARLTVNSATTYVVEADTDGNGSYDWTSGTLSWQ